MTKPPTKSVCPNCGNKPLVVESEGRRVHVLCGHAVCQGAMEDRLAARVSTVVQGILSRQDVKALLPEIMRHLPPELTRAAKR